MKNEIIIATELGVNDKPIKRLRISSITNKTIKGGFINLRPGKAYVNLYHAAVARSETAWYLGLNAIGKLSRKYNSQLNTGRVQLYPANNIDEIY